MSSVRKSANARVRNFYAYENFCDYSTVRSDVEERVAEERLAWNDKNVPAWPKNISVLRILGPLTFIVQEIKTR